MTDRTLSLRPAAMADAFLLFSWRNDPETCKASRQTSEVSWEDHRAWLSRSLASTDRLIRIAEENGTPVGVVRADRVESGSELSWTVAPEARGRGVGRRMLGSFVATLSPLLLAVVREDNFASAKIAAQAGFRRVGAAADRGFDLWVSGAVEHVLPDSPVAPHVISSGRSATDDL